jgi:hypothetical protein
MRRVEVANRPYAISNTKRHPWRAAQRSKGSTIAAQTFIRSAD